MRRACVLLVLAAVATGCGGEPSAETENTETEVGSAAYGEECGRAVEEAANLGDDADAVEDLDPALVACADLDELGAATADHPDALDGVDVETFVGNRCQYADDEAVTGSAICGELNR